MDPKQLKELRKIEQKVKSSRPDPYSSIWNFVSSVRSLPELRHWVSLESLPLRPLVIKKDQQTIVHILLVTSAEKGAMNTPWGCISLSWNEKKVFSLVEVRDLLDTVFPIDPDMVCTKKDAEELDLFIVKNTGTGLPTEKLLKIYHLILKEIAVKRGRSSGEAAKRTSPKHTDTKRKEPMDNSLLPQKTKSTNTQMQELLTAMDDLRKLSRKYSLTPISAELNRIYSGIQRPHFSVVVAGEFSRGKSTFLNKVLKKEILPIGNLPSTAMLTKITYGETIALTRYADTGTADIPIEEIGTLVADDGGNDPQGVLHLTIPNVWLKEQGIQLIDTPGAGDLFGKRATLAIEAIASCDAALIAINATMPLSLTEMSFAEHNIFTKKVPRVAFVLTKLDLIKEGERETVIDYIKKKIEHWKMSIPIFIPQEGLLPHDPAMVFSGIDRILAYIESWAKDPEHEKLRMEYISSQVASLAGMVQKTLLEREALAKQSDQEKKIKEKLKQDIQNQKLKWEDIQIWVEKKELDFGLWLKKEYLECREAMLNDLIYEIDGTSNPKEWLERYFPYRFKKTFLGFVKNIEAKAQTRIANEIREMEKSAEVLLGSKIRTSIQFPSDAAPSDLEINPNVHHMKDIQGTAKYLRWGFPILAVPVYFLAGPFGSAVPIIGSVVTELFVNSKIGKQKEILKKEIPLIVDRAKDDAINTSSERLRKLYQGILSQIKKEEQLWYLTQIHALDNTPVADSKETDQLRQDQRSLDFLLKNTLRSV